METVLEVPPRQSVEETSSKGDRTFQACYLWLERRAIPIGVCITLVAFLRFLIYCSRHLWYDEVRTSIVALQPTLTDVWKAYIGGVDVQPMTFFYVTRASCLLLGRNELALRFPEILGVLLFSWCLYFFVAKRLGVLLGLSAMILPLVTNLEFYSGEARPYGMLLGFFGLALLAWRNAVENPRRRGALALFATALALMVATHAYAVIPVSIFAVAELVRCLKNRRPDIRLWACFLAAVPPLGLYWVPLHMVKGGGVNVSGAQKAFQWAEFPFFYQDFFEYRELLLMVLGLLAVGLLLLRKGPKLRLPGFPLHETVLAGLMAVSPIFSMLLAAFVIKVWFCLPRYSICAMAGVVMVSILLLDELAPNRQVVSLTLLLATVFLFGMDQFRDSFSRDKIEKRNAELTAPFASVPANVPVVIASGLAFLPTDMYGSDSDLDRTFYLTDHEACFKYTGATIFESLPGLAAFYHFRAHFADYRTFVKEHKKFFAFGPYNYADDWQIRKLIDDGARIVEKARYKGISSDNYLFEVELP